MKSVYITLGTPNVLRWYTFHTSYFTGYLQEIFLNFCGWCLVLQARHFYFFHFLTAIGICHLYIHHVFRRNDVDNWRVLWNITLDRFAFPTKAIVFTLHEYLWWRQECIFSQTIMNNLAVQTVWFLFSKVNAEEAIWNQTSISICKIPFYTSLTEHLNSARDWENDLCL